MNDKYQQIHETVLMILHELAFGYCGLNGDANERLLRAWYQQRAKMLEESIEMSFFAPSACSKIK